MTIKRLRGEYTRIPTYKVEERRTKRKSKTSKATREVNLREPVPNTGHNNLRENGNMTTFREHYDWFRARGFDHAQSEGAAQRLTARLGGGGPSTAPPQRRAAYPTVEGSQSRAAEAMESILRRTMPHLTAAQVKEAAKGRVQPLYPAPDPVGTIHHPGGAEWTGRELEQIATDAKRIAEARAAAAQPTDAQKRIAEGIERIAGRATDPLSDAQKKIAESLQRMGYNEEAANAAARGR